LPIKLFGEKSKLDFLGLIWLSVTSLLWLVFCGPVWVPILIILIFFGITILTGRFPFRRTPFDLALGLFFLMLLVGLWVAYDRETALDKFWMLILAFLVFYAIATQPKQNAWFLMGLISILGVLLGLHFLFIYDWRTLPVDFRIITRIGLSWMAMRPAIQGKALTPNITAGILAGFFPFSLALGISTWKRRCDNHPSWLPVILAVCFTGVMALAIFMTSSRGAWLALILGLAFWLALAAGKKYLANVPGWWTLALIFGGIAIGILAIAVFFAQVSNPAHLLDLAPGLPTGQSRLRIDRLTVRLISDFTFTGGGLSAFAGLFSYYMLVIPNVMFRYSHNLYLDVALEQGLPGLLALLLILGGSGLLLFRASTDEDMRPGLNLLRLAASTSLVGMVVHGIIDDAFLGERGTPFVWVVAGLAVFMHPDVRTMAGLLPVNLDRSSKLPGFRRRVRLAFMLIAFPIVTYGVLSWRQLAAGWLANLGAVSMARVQLSDFPTNQWRDGDVGDTLVGAQGLFEHAISFDPANLTANYRLGLIAMLNQDFQTAIDYLDVAYRMDPEHRGVVKNLGYAYVWAGELDQAQDLLTEIPEAKQELGVYSWWWAVQGRSDLAQNAEEMARRLATVSSISSLTSYVRLAIT
jgi:O-Antigen ligase/Tetratricopeptide repeat